MELNPSVSPIQSRLSSFRFVNSLLRLSSSVDLLLPVLRTGLAIT